MEETRKNHLVANGVLYGTVTLSLSAFWCALVGGYFYFAIVAEDEHTWHCWASQSDSMTVPQATKGDNDDLHNVGANF